MAALVLLSVNRQGLEMRKIQQSFFMLVNDDTSQL